MINSDPNTIALGGVATGNIKAQLAAIATDAVSMRGSKPNWAAMIATIGRNVAVVAKLDVSSVRNIIKAVNISTNNAILRPSGIIFPIHRERPVL